MPIYEYVCEDCRTRHERLVMSNGATVTCPKCGSRKQTVQFSVFAAHGNGGSTSSAANGGAKVSTGGGCGCTPKSCGCH